MQYLKWSLSIRLLPAQIQLPQNGQTNKEPVAEAIVVDQSEDILYTQVYQRHDALQRHTGIHMSDTVRYEKACPTDATRK